MTAKKDRAVLKSAVTTYDRENKANRLSSISNLFSTINYEYDDGGQVKWEQNNITGANGTGQVNYYRYPSGEVAHLQYPNGTIVRREYTARGQLKLVQDGSGQQPVHYRYLRDGKVDYQDHANGTRTVFGYDARGLIGSVWHKNGNGQTLSYRDYWRDDRDRITAWRKSLDASVNPMENGRGDRYGYDEAGQLTLASYQTSNPNGNAPDPERMDVFNYDALGNRMQDDHLASRGWMNFTRDDNGLNQYTGWWPYNFIKYDDDIGNGWGAPQAANGVLMQDGWITAGYNALNHPKMIASQAYNGTGNWMWFGFDPLGRCVKRWVSSSGDPNTTTATFLYYDGWNLLQEGAGGANAQRLYIHGARVDEWSPVGRDDIDGRPEGRASWRRASQIVKSFNFTTGQSAYHHYDARGHCTMLTDPNGDILEQYDYDAFGFPRFYDATGNSLTVHDVPSNSERGYSPYGNRFLFTGREWLTDLKLYDYRNRMYQPELGRFLQPDPKQFEAGDYNLYRYCHNDPVNRVDPTGLDFYPYTGKPIPADTINGGEGMGQSVVDVRVVSVPRGDGTFALQLDVRVTHIYVANRVHFHSKTKLTDRTQNEKDVTFNEHEKQEHGKDWFGFHEKHKGEVPSTIYKDKPSADKAAEAETNKFKTEAWNANKEFNKHLPEARWKPIQDRERPH